MGVAMIGSDVGGGVDEDIYTRNNGRLSLAGSNITIQIIPTDYGENGRARRAYRNGVRGGRSHRR
jgi:hypothetical protein